MSILEGSTSKLIQIAESVNLTTECLEIHRANFETDDFHHALQLAISAPGPGEANGSEGDAIR